MRRSEDGSDVRAPSVAGQVGRPSAPRAADAERTASADNTFLLRAPALSLPKGGGAIKGIGEKFTANPVTGTGSLSVPIATSPGRGGFGPQLSLSYDSGAGNGPFGLGWSLSLPSISRKTEKGLPRYLDDTDSDTFLLAGAEDLVPLLDAQGHRPDDEDVQVYGDIYSVRRYRPRIEGLFARIERWTLKTAGGEVFWRTISRDNITSWFGRTPESRVLDPDAPDHIFQWWLCETCDDKGNVVVYRYKREDGAGVDRAQVFEANRPARTQDAATYIERILYGNRRPFMPTLATSGTGWQAPPADPDAWMFEVLFDYGEYPALTGLVQAEISASAPWGVRADAFSSHRAGFEIRTWRLCRRVLMRHHFPGEATAGAHCLVKSTDFHYEQPADPSDVRQAGYTVLTSVTHRSYQRPPGAPAYDWRELPPVSFAYSQPRIDSEVRTLAARGLPNLPVGTQGPGYQWVDLDGEGLSGVLSEQAGAWHYAPNRGGGRFGPSRVVAQVPAMAVLAGGRQQLMDLAGDGEIDLVDFSGPTAGFHERDRDGGWKRHVPFASLPNIDWQDANLRFLDLTGDGHADALLTEDEVFTWYPSLDERGFAPGVRTRTAADENAGPRLVSNDGMQTVFIADMCGDGLSDLVRIRNGEVCYWPNLGYGRFGRKVILANAPRFDAPDLFDPQRIRLADIDGSGPIDVIYLGRDGARLYFNRSGNALSDALTVPLPLATHNLGAVQVADLLGTGTACLVWNSHLPADAPRPVRYIDLMADGKPHLLTRLSNNLGGSTTIEYTPSTAFYVRDLAAGTPWITRLPFPVHCVSRVTVRDEWRDTEFSSRYSYHHGYFDGVEREFRGFGRVEQIDSDQFTDPAIDQAPVKTVTWYHTGFAVDRQLVLQHFAGEYFPQRFASRLHAAPGGSSFFERPLPEPELPPDLDASEWREALRACKGMVLRQEVYELDASAFHGGGDVHTPVRLFSAATHNCHIRCLQKRGANRHGVFHVAEGEALTYHYELALPDDGVPLHPDPRIAHSLTLRHDEYGNPQQSVSVGYGRWRPGEFVGLPRPELIEQVQAETRIAYSEIRYTGDAAIEAPGPTPRVGAHRAQRHYRLRLPCETRTYELKGVSPGSGPYFSPADFRSLDLSDYYGHRSGEAPPARAVVSKAYHEHSDAGTPQKRIVEHTRTLYCDDASDTAPPAATLPFAALGPRGLKYEDYKLALTRELLDAVFGVPHAAHPMADKLAWEVQPGASGTPPRTARGLLEDAGLSGYIAGTALDPALGRQHWMRSGRAGFAPDAHQRFFLPEEYTDPFGQTTTLVFDERDLFVKRSRDAKGNETAIASDSNQRARFDYRVLAPLELVDISGNHTEVAFDVLGRPVLAAIKGKQIGTPPRWEGDHLAGLSYLQTNPPHADVLTFCLASVLDESRALEWLATATTRFVYHFGEQNGHWAQRPAGACAIQRETHVAKLATAPTRLQVALECSDGSGAALMQKVQAEPDPQTGASRWVVNGRTVLNNKGKPVRQYEPAFSPTFGCERPGDNGVSTTLFYDAAGRVVRTEMPDGTFSRVEFSPWFSRTFDANDTVLDSRWYRERLTAAERGVPSDGAHADEERKASQASAEDQRAARLAAQHTGTAAETHLDSLGRDVVAIAHNRTPAPDGTWLDERYLTFTKLDAEGKPLWIRDARGNLVMQYITPPKPTRLADTPADPADAGDRVREYVPSSSAPAYDLAGNLLHQHSMDAGDRWMLMDAAGQPLVAWDYNERQADDGAWLQEWRLYTTDYDALRRPTAQWLRVWQRPRTTVPAPSEPYRAQAPVMLERFEYQDARTPDLANLNGQPVRHFDTSGMVETVRRDFAGHVEEVHRTLVRDTTAAWVDWQAAPAPADGRLEGETYIQIAEHDALGRMTRLYNWHRTGTRVAVYEPRYNARGLLQAETLRVRADKTSGGYNPASGQLSQAIRAIHYNAKGQKIRLELGNGTVTHYRYDALSFRLTRLYTRRGAAFTDDCGGEPPPPRTAAPDTDDPPKSCGVQNLRYAYDAAGNITHIRDEAQQTIYFRNQKVTPHCDYTYDALYRLVEASGRESAASTGSPPVPEALWPRRAVPTDDQLRRYTQRYVYDSVGNFERMEHRADRGSWTRYYATADDSNRLLRTWEGDADWSARTATEKVTYGYDPHGSMLNLKASSEAFNLHWDHRDMIRRIALSADGDQQAWYQYDSGKQRTRKRIVRSSNTTEERLYLGGFERYRRTLNGQVVEEIESHHLFEGEQRVLQVDDVVTATASAQPGPSGSALVERTCWRYQYGNHLGSVGVELDEQARVISHEECHPYGTSAYRLMNAVMEAPAKRYRYTGMERDEESGLSLHQSRYLAVALARWTATDARGVNGGINLFAYAASSPVRWQDLTGAAPTLPEVNESVTGRIIQTNAANSHAAQIPLGQGLGSSRPDHAVSHLSSGQDAVPTAGQTVLIDDKLRSLENPRRMGSAGGRVRDVGEMAEQGVRAIQNAESAAVDVKRYHILVAITQKREVGELKALQKELKQHLDRWIRNATAVPKDVLEKLNIVVTSLPEKRAALRASEGRLIGAAAAKRILERGSDVLTSPGVKKLLNVAKKAPGARHVLLVTTTAGIAAQASEAHTAARSGDNRTAAKLATSSALDAVGESPTALGMVVSAGQTGYAAGEFADWAFDLGEKASPDAKAWQGVLEGVVDKSTATNVGAIAGALSALGQLAQVANPGTWQAQLTARLVAAP